MSLYISVILVCMLAIAGACTLLSKTAFVTALYATFVYTMLVIAIDAVTASVARWLLPKRCADFEKRIYLVGAREKAFYEKIRIRKWKEKIPELGHCTGFRKNKIANPKDGAYIRRFLIEICYGELGHFFSCITGVGTLLLPMPVKGARAIATAVSFVNAVLNILPFFVLRYNSYKLRILLKQVEKRQKTLKNV